MVHKQCHKSERQSRAVNEKKPKLNFMNYRKKHFVVLKQSFIWLLKSQPKQCLVTIHAGVFVSRMGIHCFPAVSGASLNCSIYLDLPCPYLFLGLPLLGFSP